MRANCLGRDDSNSRSSGNELAIVLVLLLSSTLGWLPATGYAPLSEGLSTWAVHLILPVLTLVIGLVAHVASLQRASMIEALGAPYVRAARAKGLSERKVIMRHALRNALIPTVTVLSLDLGVLMGGIVVVETVFSYPGLGRLMIQAVEQKDLPVLQASVLTVTVIYAVANLLAPRAVETSAAGQLGHDTAMSSIDYSYEAPARSPMLTFAVRGRLTCAISASRTQ